MVILDQTIVNVALPSIQADLGFTQSGLAWVVNAYLIAFGGLLLLAGRLGDLVGRRSVFLAGLGRVHRGLAAVRPRPEPGGADRRRASCRALGGALASAVILGMIVTLFPEPRERAKAIGVYSFVASAGASIGLLAGGALTEAINWHWIFFVNVPIGVATALAARRLLERDEGIGLARGADVPGAVLVIGALMLGVYTIVGAADHGWGSARTLGLGAAAVGTAGRASWSARRAPRTRSCRCGSSARARGRREPDPGAHGRRAVRDVLPRRALPAAGARLRRARGRARVPAGRADHRRAVARASRRGSSCASARGRRCCRASC